MEGEGELETIPEGKVYLIKPGTLYALDKHDQHYLRAHESDSRLLCVFNPPLVGDEVHMTVMILSQVIKLKPI